MKNTITSELLHGRAVSAVFQDFLEPFLVEWRDMKPRPNMKQLNEWLRTPWAIWNAVVYQDFYPKSENHDLLNEMRRQALVSQLPEADGLIEFFVVRKRYEFAKFRYLFGEYDFYQKNDGEFYCRAAAVLPKNVDQRYGTDGVEHRI